MKKINIVLIIISIIVSLYYVFTKDDSLVLVLKDLSIILTINGINILNKIFKLNINEKTNLIYILFIIVAHLLGVICEWYNMIYWFDKFAHFSSGILTSFAAIYILNKTEKNNNTFFSIIFIIAFSMLVASFWEIFEYTSSCLFDVDPQKVVQTGVSDTMGDIIVAFLASILISIFYKFNKNSYANIS